MDTYYLSRKIFRICRLLGQPDAKWTLMRTFPELLFNPLMERDEFLLFKEVCRDKHVVIEYGSGGSTIFLLVNRKTVYSVESNREFYTYMCSLGIVKKAIHRNLNYKFVDLGPTNKWGKPVSSDFVDMWPAYYKQVWDDIDPHKERVEVVFIDGRFRVCCCLYSILKSLEYGWNDTVFIIHDFWRREAYHIVLRYLHELKSAQNLAAFRLRNNINVHTLKQNLQEYASVIA